MRMKITHTCALAALLVTAGCGAHGGGGGTPAAPGLPDASGGFPTSPPPLGPAPDLSLPDPVRRTLANGLQVVYVRHGTLPVVHATLVSPAGSARDPASRPGLAAFTAEMLDEGAGGRSSLELAAAVELLGATLSAGASWDAAFVDLHVLRDRLEDALPLMADVVIRPEFPDVELQRVRDERVTELQRGRDDPRLVAGNAFNALVYGDDHPYGRLPAVETTRQIQDRDLRQFHQAHYRPGGSTLILVGDVDPASLHPAVERAFGGWTGAAAPAGRVRPADHAPRTTVYLIDVPGAAQSEIRVGHPGVARDNPDYFPLVVLNTLLGGSFTSRLNINLREVHGYAYDASSAFIMRLGAGPFLASSAVFTAKTDSALVQFFHELGRIRSEPVTVEELQRAQNFVALGLPRRFETTRAVAAQLAQLEIHGLSMDFYNDFVARVMAVTPQDVQRVAGQYIQPERSVVVVVGDRSAVEEGLRGLGLGAVELRELAEFVR
jgi:zinc protease